MSLGCEALHGEVHVSIYIGFTITPCVYLLARQSFFLENFLSLFYRMFGRLLSSERTVHCTMRLIFPQKKYSYNKIHSYKSLASDVKHSIKRPYWGQICPHWGQRRQMIVRQLFLCVKRACAHSVPVAFCVMQGVYFILSQITFSSVPITPRVGPHPVALDLKGFYLCAKKTLLLC